MKTKAAQPAKRTPGKKQRRLSDPSQDVFRGGGPSLDVFFKPKNVAVIGATESAGAVGRTVLSNLLKNPFGGAVFPVNPKRSSVLGVKAYPRVSSLPEPADLAVIVTPAPVVPDVISECAESGVAGAIVISAGFKEHGEAGAALEEQVRERARGRLRVIGPNCLGVMCPPTGINATFAHGMALPGNVGFLSQSGALCTAVLDWSLKENVGFSAFVSLGSMLDVGWGDLIDHLGNDPRTQSIVIYMETVGDARAFLSAAREVALTKPIIVIKAGRTEESAKAAVSHTGSLAGSDEVLDAAFRRCGVLRVNTVAELFSMAGVLAKQPRPRGPRLTVLTNAGGPGVLAADSLIANGGKLSLLSPATMKALDGFLPAPWSHGNPVDILGDAAPERYARALEAAAKDENSDGLLVILTPQDMTDPAGTAGKLAPYARIDGKPVLASWMGGETVERGRAILSKAGIPVFSYPDTAAQVFTYMWKYSENLKSLYETPSLVDGEDGADPGRAEAILSAARRGCRTLLTERESKEVLSAYGVPTVPALVAADEEEAVRAAERLGYPVVLKLHSGTITHKSDVGGVRLDLRDGVALRRAFREMREAVAAKAGPGHFQGGTVQPMVKLEGYEAILGSSYDPQFGPVLLFGSGGRLVEVYKDRALGLPPLNTTLARRMLERTRLYAALKGVRGRRPLDLPLLERILVRFSRLVQERPEIREIDVNPLLLSPDGIVALDARVVLHPPETSGPLARTAIRPYPAQYAAPFKMKNGETVLLRPIRPEDEPWMAAFHRTLSERSVYFRYLHPLKLSQRVAHERLTRICFTDYDREMVLVADRQTPGGGHEIRAVGRLSRRRGAPRAEFSVLVSDSCQRQGLGTELVRRLLDIARREGVAAVTADIHPDNGEMQAVCRKLGFRLRRSMEAGEMKADIALGRKAGI